MLHLAVGTTILCVWLTPPLPQAPLLKEGYQYDFSKNSPHVFNRENRERKARTMVAVLSDYLGAPLSQLRVLNVGGSAGVIDNYLADRFEQVVGIDIDKRAIDFARSSFSKENLEFQVADALDLPFSDSCFDVIVCSHVYEHVADPSLMMDEIRRVLRPGGVCYFSAGNRLAWNEPHYNLPLLSVVPRPLAHVYMRLSGKGDRYHEKHLTYWGLRKLVSNFGVKDYTVRLISDAREFHTDYMLPPDSAKSKLAMFVAKRAYWAFPGYVWLLEKA